MNVSIRGIDADVHVTVGQARLVAESLTTVAALVEGTESG
jgi:hypothetical protein